MGQFHTFTALNYKYSRSNTIMYVHLILLILTDIYIIESQLEGWNYYIRYIGAMFSIWCKIKVWFQHFHTVCERAKKICPHQGFLIKPYWFMGYLYWAHYDARPSILFENFQTTNAPPYCDYQHQIAVFFVIIWILVKAFYRFSIISALWASQWSDFVHLQYESY